jgi:acetate kinase
VSGARRCILTINAGSSSIRFAVYQAGATPRLLRRGMIDRIGSSGTTLIVNGANGGPPSSRRLATTEHHAATAFLIDWLATQPLFASVTAVGHRVVHGMARSEPELITPKLLRELHRITPYAPDHLPREIALIEAFRRWHPQLPQIACFDTAFHRSMPHVARMLPLPRRYATKGVERYGFHGLSYAYLMAALARIDPAAANGRVVLAHLGNGASLAAVDHGKSVDTSMGFTPASGLMMGTRTGELDPGIAYFLARTERISPARFQQMVNHESGLLGLSGTSADMRDLLAREASDPRAAEAIALFCYQAKKWIGSFAAVLGGLDTLVFAGGIGEHAPVVRERICAGLGFLGVDVDHKRNEKQASLISPARSRVKVRVIPTDEEIMIATLVNRQIDSPQRR